MYLFDEEKKKEIYWDDQWNKGTKKDAYPRKKEKNILIFCKKEIQSADHKDINLRHQQ